MLNDRQKLFISEYQTDKSPIQAALRAGYAPRTARQAARWLRPGDALYRPELARHVLQLDPFVAQPDEVLAALTSILRREVMERVVVTSSEKRPVTLDDGKTRYEERRESSVVDVPPKLSDVIRAAELLGRQHGLWSERAVDMSDLVRIIDDVCGIMADSGGSATDEGISPRRSPAPSLACDDALDFHAEAFEGSDALGDFANSSDPLESPSDLDDFSTLPF